MSVTFQYTNYKGVTALRQVKPLALMFIRAPGFGYQPGWFLHALDLDKNEERSFALSHIKLPEGQSPYLIPIEVESSPPALDYRDTLIGDHVKVSWVVSAPGALQERRQSAFGKLSKNETGYWLTLPTGHSLRLSHDMTVEKVNGGAA